MYAAFASASSMGFGGSKSGNPWDRLMAPYSLLMRVIRRMTESVKVPTRWLSCGILCSSVSKEALKELSAAAHEIARSQSVPEILKSIDYGVKCGRALRCRHGRYICSRRLPAAFDCPYFPPHFSAFPIIIPSHTKWKNALKYLYVDDTMWPERS